MDQKCFLWCHVKHINPVKLHPERITKVDTKLVENLDYDGVDFPVQEKDFSKIETKSNICMNVFCYENKLSFPIYISDQKFENSMDLLLITDGDKLQYVYIKDFGIFVFHKTKNKNKKYFCKSCLQCFSSEYVLTGHKEFCFSVNGAQSVKLENGTIKFKNCFKQTPVSFKIYADFKCNLKSVAIYEVFYTKKMLKLHSLQFC